MVPGTQRHCLTALYRMYVQDPKGREDVVLRIHLVGWYHHQAVRSLRKGTDQWEPCKLVQTPGRDKRRTGRGKEGGRKEGRRKWEEGKESRMIFKPERWNIKKKQQPKIGGKKEKDP